MSILMGPVLAFRGAEIGRCKVSILIVVEPNAPGDPEPVVALDPAVAAAGGVVTGPVEVLENAGRRALVWEASVAAGAVGARVVYSVDGAPHAFHVPADGRPPRMAFASCNGFSDPALVKKVGDQNERWRHLGEKHVAAPYHLLLLGGDQIYGDEIWTKRVPTMREWSRRPKDARIVAKFTDDMRRQVEKFYFDVYVERWAQPEVAAVLASIPTAMMWDDHDIFDGWGSHDVELQACDVFQGIYRAARTAFLAFQRQTRVGVPAPGTLPAQEAATWAFIAGTVAVLAIDLRSERTDRRVMAPASAAAMATWLKNVPQQVKHLILVSSIPVVYADFGMLESGLGWIPGDQELEDDLRDHWQSPLHVGERARLIHRLLAFAADRRVRVTIVSGDVHVGALGVIESTRDGAASRAGVINQLISSGIVHPPPPAIVVWAVRNVLSTESEPDQGIRTRLLAFPNSPHRASIVPARNWLAIEPDDPGPGDAGRLWANWHVEGERDPLTKAIHPVG